MAWPSFMKKIACGMGALSHSLLYQISFIDVAVYMPDGVEEPRLPVETGQSYFSSPLTSTVIFWLALSIVIRIEEPTGLVALAVAFPPPAPTPHRGLAF